MERSCVLARGAVLKFWSVKNVGHGFGYFVGKMRLGDWKGVGQQT